MFECIDTFLILSLILNISMFFTHNEIAWFYEWTGSIGIMSMWSSIIAGMNGFGTFLFTCLVVFPTVIFPLAMEMKGVWIMYALRILFYIWAFLIMRVPTDWFKFASLTMSVFAWITEGVALSFASRDNIFKIIIMFEIYFILEILCVKIIQKHKLESDNIDL